MRPDEPCTQRCPGSASERRLRHVVEHLPEVFFETDGAGRWTYLNRAWTVVTGFAVEEGLGRSFTEFVWPGDVDIAIARFLPLIGGGRHASRHEIRYRTKDGGFRWLEVHMHAVPGDDDHTIGTSGTLQDVTAQRDLSEQLVRAREAAIQASRTKSDFLANMSHEIRTPMNGVIGLTDLLLDTSLTPEQREYACGVKQSAEALLTLINDILDFSKIEAGKLSISRVAHDLHEVVREAVNLVDIKARNKGFRVALGLEDGVPIQVMGDRGRIRQVLINLIDNAVKFTYVGGVTVSVSSEPRAGGGVTVRFAVRDTGIGIERDKLDAIFEKFTQADASTTRRFGGTGLGLAICRQLVELMEGGIGVTSEPGRGSTFWFHLPLMAVEAAPAPGVPRVEPATEAGAGLRPYRVLVVEDNAINLKVACRMLEKVGCAVDVAENGAVAVQMVGGTAYDVVFMDCQMPVLDGYEATAAIRRLPDGGRTRIVAMTAHALAADRERCLAAGMDDYIRKPITVDEIRRALQAAGRRDNGPTGREEGGTPEAEQAPPSFDPDALWSRMSGDKAAIADLVDLLSADGPAYWKLLDRAIAVGDLAATASLAHTIKGSVANFGARGAVELAAEIEAAVRAGAPGATREPARRLELELSRLIADLREWLATVDAPAHAAH